MIFSQLLILPDIGDRATKQPQVGTWLFQQLQIASDVDRCYLSVFDPRWDHYLELVSVGKRHQASRWRRTENELQPVGRWPLDWLASARKTTTHLLKGHAEAAVLWLI